MLKQQPYIHLYERYGIGSEEWQAVIALSLNSSLVQRGSSQTLMNQELNNQRDFINALCAIKPKATFSLRYLSLPYQNQAVNKITITLFIKVEANSQSLAIYKAQEVFSQSFLLLSSLMSSYDWSVITTGRDFLLHWQPFDLSSCHLAEMSHHQEALSLSSRHSYRKNKEISKDSLQISYPFVSRKNSFSRLLQIMLLHSNPLIWQCSINPSTITEPEQEFLDSQITLCEEYLNIDDTLPSTLIKGTKALEAKVKQAYSILLKRASQVTNDVMLFHSILASPLPIPNSLVETLASELFDSDATTPSAYKIAVLRTNEAKFFTSENLRFLEFNYIPQEEDSLNQSHLYSLIDSTEAVSFFRLPVATTEGLIGFNTHFSRLRSLPAVVAENMDKLVSYKEKVFLGKNSCLNNNQPIFLSEKERMQHTYVIGQTGSGKTTLLKSMILSDIFAGKGLAVIDPHGDLFEEILGLIPDYRWEDVVVIDPTDSQFSVGFNPLECSSEDECYHTVREFRLIIERLLNDQYGNSSYAYTGPMFYQHLQMNSLLVMSDPDNPGTLLDLYEIFQREDYWKKWVPLKIQDSKLQNWVDNVLPTVNYLKRGNELTSLGEYIASKIEDFILDPRMRRIFGQRRSTINLSNIMNEGKILLVNLAKGQLSEPNSRFLGMILMSKLLQAAMGRTNLSIQQRRPFYLYVDEFQSLATENFVLMLSEARKFGLGLVLANQFLSQIENKQIIDSIIGNVGTFVSFRLGHKDAEMLEKLFHPAFDYYDLTNLPNWQACIKTSINGQTTTAFSLQTVLLKGKSDEVIARAIKNYSFSKYCTSKDSVEYQISKNLDMFKTNKHKAVNEKTVYTKY